MMIIIRHTPLIHGSSGDGGGEAILARTWSDALSAGPKFGFYLVLPNTTEQNRTGSNRIEYGRGLAGYPANEKRVTLT
jgi:hypothetical protein